MLKPGTPAGAPSPPRRQDYKAAAFPPSASSRPGSSRAPAGEEGTVRRTLDGFALAARSARTPLDGDPPATMKLWVALAVLALVLAQALADELGDNDQLGYFADWSDGDQDKEELPFPFEHLLQRIARRPRPQQFYGLMGKRDAGYGPLSHKRSSEWNTAQIYERRRK
ncbi:protachykinin-1 isoform X2 [Paroedura picta]|uniref:protachykinin-1 isoform X2 n=1 Tax=Paroedura picta TaxID=143630 RepID=UPI004056DDC7